MAKKSKVTLENLDKAAEEILGITAQDNKVAETVSSDLTEQAVVLIQEETSYLENSLGAALDASEYLMQKYVSASKAAAIIKQKHREMKDKVSEQEQSLLSLKKNLLAGAVVIGGITIPAQREDSPIVERIRIALKQANESMKKVANVVANDFGFETSDEVFAYFNEK